LNARSTECLTPGSTHQPLQQHDRLGAWCALCGGTTVQPAGTTAAAGGGGMTGQAAEALILDMAHARLLNCSESGGFSLSWYLALRPSLPWGSPSACPASSCRGSLLLEQSAALSPSVVRPVPPLRSPHSASPFWTKLTTTTPSSRSSTDRLDSPGLSTPLLAAVAASGWGGEEV